MTQRNIEGQRPAETSLGREQSQLAMSASNDAYYTKLNRLGESHWQEVTKEVATAGNNIATKRAEYLQSWGVKISADKLFLESEASREVEQHVYGELTFTDMHVTVLPKREDASAVKRDMQAGGPVGLVYDKNQIKKMDGFRRIHKNNQLIAAADVYWGKQEFEEPIAIGLGYSDAAQNNINEVVCKTDDGWVRLEKQHDGRVVALERLGKDLKPQSEFSRLSERVEEAQHIQAGGSDAVAEYACITNTESTAETYLHFTELLCDKARQLQVKYADEIASLRAKIKRAPAEARPEIELQIQAIEAQLPDEVEKIVKHITKTGQERAAQFENFKSQFKRTNGDRYSVLLATITKEIPEVKLKIFEVSEILRKHSLETMLAEQDTFRWKVRNWLRNI